MKDNNNEQSKAVLENNKSSFKSSFETEVEKKKLIDNNFDNNYNIEEDIEKEEITINDKARNSIFIILCIEYCISSCDGGIVPQQNKHLQHDFEDNGDSRVGLFGSIDYIGRIFGAVVMSLLINRIDRKLFLAGSCFLKSITLIISLFYEKYYLNLLTRLLSGIPQTLLTSYGTIWTDQFGKRKKRTMMLPILQFAALLGIIVGYCLGILSDKILSKNNKDVNNNHPYYGWRLSFGVEGVGLGIIGIIILFYKKIYFSTTFYLNEDDDYKGREKSDLEIAKEKNESGGWKAFLEQFPKIMCNKIFFFMSISNTVAFFGMRIIQFYADKYMELVLKISKKIKFFLYIILCMTGPVVGILICGIICSKIGGYTSKNGMIFILALNIIACVSSVFITATLNSWISLSASWLYLFCLAAVTPLQGGVIIASLPKDLKGNGFSINMFFLNLIGSFPSSYVYGLIADYFKVHDPEQKDMRYRTAMIITMYYNYFGLILAGIAGILRLNLKGELGSDMDEETKKIESIENREKRKSKGDLTLN